jgi:hypothetical protein
VKWLLGRIERCSEALLEGALHVECSDHRKPIQKINKLCVQRAFGFDVEEPQLSGGSDVEPLGEEEHGKDKGDRCTQVPRGDGDDDDLCDAGHR